MRFSTVIVALAASVASASFLVERQTGFPACSLSCLTNADVGTCSPTDAACLCKSDTYLRSITSCSSCNIVDQSTAASSLQQLCEAAGVDISTNPAAQPTGTAAATGAASAATTSAAASAASVTPTKNSATGSVVGKGMVIGGFVAAAAVLAL
ncbi:hypothetical protein M407DRAFT_233323 [Tulasnella calospora MUT 4182]|uniref:CFEM domain-containing protein n=1 Tax=Tulasnella calospora MUT 4182 TaxID=1051891 RepID=A0A0C3K432_9AGAM|nr:hypothetical protein M407DRAFT_233323 [Tulasnella calospora MUT 4182]